MLYHIFLWNDRAGSTFLVCLIGQQRRNSCSPIEYKYENTNTIRSYQGKGNKNEWEHNNNNNHRHDRSSIIIIITSTHFHESLFSISDLLHNVHCLLPLNQLTNTLLRNSIQDYIATSRLFVCLFVCPAAYLLFYSFVRLFVCIWSKLWLLLLLLLENQQKALFFSTRIFSPRV